MKFAVLFCVLSFSLLAPTEISAQKPQRIRLYKSHGESGAAVEGAISGTINENSSREFVFRARRHQGMDLNIDTKSGGDASFEIIAPNGKTLVKDTTDFLDEAPATGDYTVRVYVVGAKAGGKKKSSFRFSVFMYI